MDEFLEAFIVCVVRFIFFTVHEWEVSQVKVGLGGVCQDEVVLSNSAL